MKKEMIKNFIKDKKVKLLTLMVGGFKVPALFSGGYFSTKKRDLDLWFFTEVFGDLEGVDTLILPL